MAELKSGTFILSRTPFRLPLGGGSTDLPSYYEKYGGFIFAVSINLYMDIIIKRPVVDDLIHLHYASHEAEEGVENIKHNLAREALKAMDVKNRISISFKSDTPAGTGLGSSGACAVGLFKGLALYQGREMSNLEAAERSFALTEKLKLPDGKQDPYSCALGGFTVLEIAADGTVQPAKPQIDDDTIDKFFKQALFFYTGINRDSHPLLAAQNEERVLALKHQTKTIGRQIYQSFLKGDLDQFGHLLDEHWQIKKSMSGGMSSPRLDEVYQAARTAGALGGKILGAGGGGYFMFYCSSMQIQDQVRRTLNKYNLREIKLAIDKIGSRTKTIDL